MADTLGTQVAALVAWAQGKYPAPTGTPQPSDLCTIVIRSNGGGEIVAPSPHPPVAKMQWAFDGGSDPLTAISNTISVIVAQ